MKVILADDEKWVRIAIASVTPFERLGFNLVSEASNGLEALELCRQHKPDILLTDIRMPGLNGLELISRLRQELPAVKVVIISGHSDFVYAKTAIKYGVYDYILKPVDGNELTGILLKLKENIQSERKQQEENSFIRLQYHTALPLMCENFLNQLLTPNSMLMDNVKDELGKYGINYTHPYFAVIVFSPDNTSPLSNNKSMKRFKTLIAKVMQRYTYAFTISTSKDPYNLVAIINHQYCDETAFLKKPLLLCSLLTKKRFGTSITIGVSSMLNHIRLLPELYKQACESLQTSFWQGHGKVFYYSKNKKEQSSNLQVSSDAINEIVINVKLHNCTQAISCIEHICAGIIQHETQNPELIKEFFWTLILSIVNKLDMQFVFIEHELALTGIHPHEKLKRTTSVEVLISYVKELIIRIADRHNKTGSGGGTDVIALAKDIIDENYSKNISLEDVAKYVHLNANYFSELFKKDTGMSFIDYKTHIRIEKAKELLGSSELSITEICTKVGFNDSKYFSKLFKKNAGMTLNEYRIKYGIKVE